MLRGTKEAVRKTIQRKIADWHFQANCSGREVTINQYPDIIGGVGTMFSASERCRDIELSGVRDQSCRIYACPRLMNPTEAIRRRKRE